MTTLAFVAFGSPVTDEVFSKLLNLVESDFLAGKELLPYLFMADESAEGEGGFFGVANFVTRPGNFSAMVGNVVPAESINEFIRVAGKYNIPPNQFGYYLVNQVV